jgi:hypothetical protein
VETIIHQANGIRMLDALVICLFLAMVLTPAVVAARSGDGSNPDK